MFRIVKELVTYRTLLRHLVILDLKVRYRGSFFGFMWTLLNPLMLMLVMWVVFSQFGRIEEKNYALFLLSGLMTWIFFSQSIERSLNAIVQNKGLIQKIYMPKIIFPVSVVASNLVNLLFFLFAYLILAFFVYEIHSTVALIVPALAMLFLLSAGAATLICTLNVFFRDFTHLTAVIMRALFYLTPVLYPPEILSERINFFLRFNPAYYPVIAVRDVLYYGRIPPMELWIVGFASALVMCVVGLTIFSSSEERFVYYA